jgi:hypothetical protein
MLRGIWAFQPSVVNCVEQSLVTIYRNPPGSRTRAAAVPVLPSYLFALFENFVIQVVVVGVMIDWIGNVRPPI